MAYARMNGDPEMLEKKTKGDPLRELQYKIKKAILKKFSIT